MMKNVLAFALMLSAANVLCTEKTKPVQCEVLMPGLSCSETPELDDQKKDLVGPKIPILMFDRERKIMNLNPLQVKIFLGSKDQVESELNEWLVRHVRVLLTPAIQFYALDKDQVYVLVTYSFHQRYVEPSTAAEIVDVSRKNESSLEAKRKENK